MERIIDEGIGCRVDMDVGDYRWKKEVLVLKFWVKEGGYVYFWWFFKFWLKGYCRVCSISMLFLEFWIYSDGGFICFDWIRL